MVERLSLQELDGQTVIVKRAADATRRRQLAHEAAQLASLQHPGVVELVSFTEQDTHDTLVTVCAGTVTLADYSPADLGAVAGVMAGAATVVSDLHASGICHGAIQADHVIVGESRHPVLCSFGRSGPVSAEAVAEDITGLVEMVGALAARARRTSGGGTRRQERELRAIASASENRDVKAADIAARLAAVPGSIPPKVAALPGSITPLVDAIAEPDQRAAPSPELNDSGVSSASPLEGTRTWRDRVPAALEPKPKRPLALPAAIMGALVLAAAVAWSSRGHDSDLRSSTEPVGRSLLALPAPTKAPDSDAACSDVSTHQSAIDVDGDGCPDDVEVAGHMVRIGDIWYAAGGSGDVVVVGDWNCDRVATVALLRPTSGEVFVFESWATETADLEVPPLIRVEDATNLTVRRDPDCDTLYAVDDFGIVQSGPIAVP